MNLFSIAKPYTLIILFVFAYTFNSCTKKEEVKPKDLPSLTTTAISSIAPYSAISGGQISNSGSSQVTSRGVVWSVSPSPSINLATKTTDSSGTGTFISHLYGLSGATKYYVRAYATSSIGTSYGNEITFTTLDSLPVLTTNEPSNISSTSANSGGSISSQGAASITAKGIVWGTNPSPTVALSSKSSDGNGTGNFTSSATGLIGATKYYVRAYATSTIGTGYGNEVTFTTMPGLPVITTNDITNIKSISALSGGSVSNDGGATVTARGIVWSTSPSPTVSLATKSTNGAGTGDFVSNITGLSYNIKYYVRAYATNSIGTSYGNEISFTTIYTIGETGPAGGYIFYDKGSYSNGWRYLEAAPSDYSGPKSTVWWNGTWSYVAGAGISPDKSIGAGKANTLLIMAANNNLDNAAKICDDYAIGTYTDWYLPSLGELELICQNLYTTGIGTFTKHQYWSSTNDNHIKNAWSMQIFDGCQNRTDLGMTETILAIRPVRQF